MKMRIILFILIIGISNACSDSDALNLNDSPSNQFGKNPIESGMGANVDEQILLGCGTCAQTDSYTVQLQTLGGTPIDPANVSPSTQYRIVITYSGSYPGCTNVAYCVVGAIGFTGGCNDSTNGSTTITITTNSSLPGFGILGAVGPTDCSGSLASAQNNPSSWRDI